GDGTGGYRARGWHGRGAGLGCEPTPEDHGRLRGGSRMQPVELVLEVGGVRAEPAEGEQMAENKNQWFNELIAKLEPGEIFPGVKELVADIRNTGRKVALASSSKNAQLVVDRLEIRDLFEVIIDGSMIEHTKPDPEIFHLAAKRL